VGDDETCPLMSIFFSKTAGNQSPSQIHVLVSLVKSKQRSRSRLVLADVKTIRNLPA